MLSAADKQCPSRICRPLESLSQDASTANADTEPGLGSAKQEEKEREREMKRKKIAPKIAGPNPQLPFSIQVKLLAAYLQRWG